jgi:hypothetical protein
MVGSASETPTKGRYGCAILPLLTGEEVQVDENTIKYIRTGRLRDTHISLLSQVGYQIKVLRGYRLKSVTAPQAGVRYDGLYVASTPS